MPHCPQAAWKLLRKEFPWITTTCCGTHVLSLELKDMAKLPQVAAIIEKVHLVLKLFWGRKRWPRRRLREAIYKRTGLSFGLYRATVTRFAGKFREMQRLLRVKEDLQGIVVTAEYARQKFSTRGRREEDIQDGEVLDKDIGGTVRAILLDEDAFWKPLTVILQVAMPLIKLLRALDGNKPMMGKVYMRMFQIGERIAALQEKGVLWAAGMKRIHEDRWEYIHSPFHSAGYALDPEFIECVGDLDSATQEGVLLVIQRMCLRDAMAANAHEELTLSDSSPEVVERVAQAEREFSVYQEQKGAFVHGSALSNAKTMEPAAWWSMYGRHLPILSTIASRVLAQPASSSAAERNWSVYGQIHSAQKARMKHGTADKLVYCHESLHIEQKLLDAGWQADVERWETDSESGNGSERDEDFDDELNLNTEEILRLCA